MKGQSSSNRLGILFKQARRWVVESVFTFETQRVLFLPCILPCRFADFPAALTVFIASKTIGSHGCALLCVPLPIGLACLSCVLPSSRSDVAQLVRGL